MPLPPGPKLPPAIQLFQFLRRPLEFFEDAAAKYGDPFTIRLMGFPPIVLFSGPENLKEIFSKSPEDLVAGEANVVQKPFLGENSVLLLDGPAHKRARFLLAPPLRGERMMEYGEQMIALTNDSIDGWPVGSEFPLMTKLQDVRLQVVLHTQFGMDDPGVREHAKKLLHEAIDRGMAPGMYLPFVQKALGERSPWAKFQRAKTAVDEMMLAFVKERRAKGTAGRVDILSKLVDAVDEAGEPMGDQEITDQIMTLLLAGHEPVPGGLGWTLRHILPEPALMKALKEELSGAMDGGSPVPAKVASLPLMHATICETLRLEPVVLMVQRLTKKAMRIGGVDLPANTRVACSPYLAHQRPESWPDPKRFDPSRFITGKPSPYEWLPFGGGHRRCLGMAFGLYEIKMLLAAILARTDLQIAPGKTIKLRRRAVNFVPSEGLPVVLAKAPRPRGSAAGSLAGAA